MKTTSFFSILVLLMVVPSAHADMFFGTAARTMFETNRDTLGDAFIDFENVAPGPLTNQLPGVSFRTTLGRFGASGPLDLPVAVLPWDFVTTSPKAITGTRTGSPRFIPEGQNRYEIVFDIGQRRAGVQRPWNTSSLTRFYAGNTLLAEHQNTENSEFVGFIANSNDPSTWVTRIEIDGVQLGGVFQVGNTDDLFFGSVAAIPEPGSAATWLILLGSILNRRRRLTRQ